MSRIVQLDAIRFKHAGLAASIVSAYHRHLDDQRKAEQACNEWVGEPKQRLVWTLTVESVKTIPSYYSYTGATYLHKMNDAEGHAFVWFASNFQADPGDVLTGKGTIKEHGEYRGVKQTVLTRCKFEVIQP